MADIKVKYFMGIDVQLSRGCSYYILDRQYKYLGSGWIKNKEFDVIVKEFLDLCARLSDKNPNVIAIGIDAPRMPLLKPRKYYWDSKRTRWRSGTTEDKGYGRHCEIVIKSLNIANPQWTPTIQDAPEWMKLGFELFRGLKMYPLLYEVFPSAAYSLLEYDDSLSVTIPFRGFKPGPKDMLDACIASATVLEYLNGHGCEIGGGDELGTIILPRKVNNYNEILRAYPTDVST